MDAYVLPKNFFRDNPAQKASAAALLQFRLETGLDTGPERSMAFLSGARVHQKEVSLRTSLRHWCGNPPDGSARPL